MIAVDTIIIIIILIFQAIVYSKQILKVEGRTARQEATTINQVVIKTIKQAMTAPVIISFLVNQEASREAILFSIFFFLK